MSIMKHARRSTALVLAMALGGALLGSSAASADTPSEELSAAATAAAVTAADPTGTVVASIDQAAGGGWSAAAGGGSVEIPADAAEGIELTAAGAEALTINLPGAGQARHAQLVGSTAVYENAAPSTDIAVQATDTGGVRQLITIAGPAAPDSYDFPVDVPGGAQIVLTDDGGAQVVRDDGAILAAVAPAWARDANGTPIPTGFTTDGSTLTQHVTFDENTAFPVTADPSWSVFGSYVACITGVGVPIGAAIAFAMYVGPEALYVLATNKATAFRVGGPPSVGALVKPYARTVYNNCRRFIQS